MYELHPQVGWQFPLVGVVEGLPHDVAARPSPTGCQLLAYSLFSGSSVKGVAEYINIGCGQERLTISLSVSLPVWLGQYVTIVTE